MPSINEVTLMGHMGQDAETRFTPNGVACTKFSIATTRSYKKGDEWEEKTNWHNIVAWRVNDRTLEYLRKGNLVYIKGYMETRQYEMEGQKRWITEVIADRVYFLREPFRTGPRDEQAPPAPRAEQAPISDDDIPF